ncbi:hypothetical protein I7I51_02963 [Histoplasma capsulatum]|uniref:Uncharacterized protein n=1 Tax=Ajellomyces capsulatus TaxID=5037 RepID=A0A8A1MPS9_AJECA|nr:hypothetical protein I7I51_02963 [Histoplasma capsulatum]
MNLFLSALILWQGSQTKIANLLQEIDRFTQLCRRTNFTSSKDAGFANGYPVAPTQAALDEGTSSNQIPTLLVFTSRKLTAAKRFNLETEVYIRLEERNEDINYEAAADILAREEFTLQELTDCFQAQVWKYNSGALAKAVFNYEAKSCV